MYSLLYEMCVLLLDFTISLHSNFTLFNIFFKLKNNRLRKACWSDGKRHAYKKIKEILLQD